MKNQVLSTFCVAYLLLTCGCHHGYIRDEAFLPADGARVPTASARPINVIPVSRNMLSAIKDLQKTFRARDSGTLTEHTSFPLRGLNALGLDSSNNSIGFRNAYSRIFFKELQDFLCTMSIDSIRFRKGFFRECYLHQDARGHYIPVDSCKDIIYLAVGDDDRDFSVSVNNNVYVNGYVGCNETATVFDFSLDSLGSYHLDSIQVAQ